MFLDGLMVEVET